MPFDADSARPVDAIGFDPSSATPVEDKPKRTIADRASPMERLRAREDAMASTYGFMRENIVSGIDAGKQRSERLAPLAAEAEKTGNWGPYAMANLRDPETQARAAN